MTNMYTSEVLPLGKHRISAWLCQCGEVILFSEARRMDYIERGYKHEPKRCRKCKGKVSGKEEKGNG